MSNGGGSFRRIYPNQESIVLDHGLNSKYEKALIQDSESPDCLNVIFTNRSVGTRGGAVKLNTTAVGSYAFDGLYTRRANDTSETMLAFAGGTMYTLGSTTFITVPSAQSVFSLGVRVGMELAENYAFIGNGTVTYKWDGTYFTQHGVSAPVATCTVSSGTTGSLTTNGTYVYKVSFVNSALVESNLGPASTTFTVSSAGNAIVVSNIPTATFPSQGVAFRRLYRTQSNGVLSFQRVTTLNDNTTTTFTDTLADTSLGAVAPTDNGVPPKYNAIIYHRGLLFCNDTANPNFIWYSNVFTPYTFASTNFFRVGDNTSDLIKGFAAFDNYIVIFCEQSTWINFMPDPATPSGWRQIRTLSPYGSKSPYCLLNVNNSILHPAVQNKKFVGFARLRGNTLDPSNSLLTITSAGSLLTSDKIETDMFNVQETYLGNISGIVYKNQAYVSLTYGSGNTTNNRIYFFDFSMENLTPDQMVSWSPWTGINSAQMTIYGGKLYAASSKTNGFVYQIGDTGVYSDDGSAINSYIWTKEFSGFEPDTNYTKDFRYVNMLIDLSGSYYMSMKYRTDSDSGTGTNINISVNPGGSLWGAMMWGRDTWGGGAEQYEPRIYLGSGIRGKRLQLQFNNQNTAGQRFKVHRLQFAYNMKGYR